LEILCITPSASHAWKFCSSTSQDQVSPPHLEPPTAHPPSRLPPPLPRRRNLHPPCPQPTPPHHGRLDPHPIHRSHRPLHDPQQPGQHVDQMGNVPHNRALCPRPLLGLDAHPVKRRRTHEEDDHFVGDIFGVLCGQYGRESDFQGGGCAGVW
jgi:hypothetical protein